MNKIIPKPVNDSNVRYTKVNINYNKIPNHKMENLNHEMKNIPHCCFKKFDVQIVGKCMYA